MTDLPDVIAARVVRRGSARAIERLRPIVTAQRNISLIVLAPVIRIAYDDYAKPLHMLYR
jgi:hypothetical protein